MKKRAVTEVRRHHHRRDRDGRARAGKAGQPHGYEAAAGQIRGFLGVRRGFPAKRMLSCTDGECAHWGRNDRMGVGISDRMGPSAGGTPSVSLTADSSLWEGAKSKEELEIPSQALRRGTHSPPHPSTSLRPGCHLPLKGKAIRGRVGNWSRE